MLLLKVTLPNTGRNTHFADGYLVAVKKKKNYIKKNKVSVPG